MPPQQGGPWENYDGPWKQYQGRSAQPASIQSVTAPPPEPPPSKAFPLPLGTAARLTAQYGIPGLVAGVAGAEPSEMSEHAAAALRGIPDAITSIPGMIRGAGSALWQNLKGIYGNDPSQLAQGAEQTGELVEGAVRGMTKPVTVPAKGAAALLAPEQFDAPSRDESLEAARGAGANLGGVLLGAGTAKAGARVNRYIQEAPVRKGYTTINPETLKPELPVPPVPVEMGKRIPKDGAPGTLYKVHDAAHEAARALGGDASLEALQDLSSTFSRAFPDLIDAVRQNPYLRGPIINAERLGKTAEYARSRVWSKAFEPALKEAGPIELDAIAPKMIERIPETYKLLEPAKAEALAKVYRDKFSGKATDSASFHKVVKEARNEISSVLGKNPFEKQAMLGTPEGQIAEAHYEVLRDHLYDHVKQRTGTDLRPTGDAYGALSQLEQEALGMPGPRGLLEEIFSSYTFPTPRAVAARVGERIGKHMLSNPKKLASAFARYAKEFASNPAEQAKVTQPFRGKRQAPVAPPSMRVPNEQGGKMQDRPMGGQVPPGRVRYRGPAGPPNPRPPKS